MLVRRAIENGEGEFVFLAGDCAYNNIPPNFIQGTIHGLTVPHHGGKLNNKAYSLIPQPVGNHDAAVSVGHPNNYQHPDVAAIAAHTTAGWTVADTSASGHLSYGTSNSSPGPCTMPNCVVRTTAI